MRRGSFPPPIAEEYYSVEVRAHNGIFWKYSMHLVKGWIRYGPDGGGDWYGRNPDRLARKGLRVARRLNRRMDVTRARQEALEARDG